MILLSFAINYFQYISLRDSKDNLHFTSRQPADIPRVLAARLSFDGRRLAHCVPVSDSMVCTLFPRTISTYANVMVLNRIECMSCYEYHRDHVRELSETAQIPILAVARGDDGTLWCGTEAG
ncbi:MAG: hypothetical protein C4326_15045, partial [Ignavibacteria bacterium]